MTPADLIAAARKAPKADRRLRNTDRWMPVVSTLRAKGYSYAAIHTFLREHGEDVHDHPVTFASAVSRRYRRWLKLQ
jgi:hypothetical protein